MKARILGLFTAFCLLLPGCGAAPAVQRAQTAASPPATSIRIMAYNNRSVRAAYLAYLAEQLPDIAIEYDYVPLEYYSSTLNAQLLSGDGPDIIEVGGETRLLAKTNCLMPLSGEAFIQKYSSAGLLPFTVDGKVYAAPLQSWFEGIYYNKAIFHRLNLRPPENFEEFIALHKALRAAGIKPQAMGAQSWEPMMKQSIGLVNDEFYSRPENAGFDAAFDAGGARLSDAWLPAVTLWSRMISEGCLTPDMLSCTYEQALDEFASERAAMWESGPWSAGAVLRENPDIELGMFPIPGTQDGEGWLVGGPGSALAINNNSAHKEAALRVLSLTATPGAQQKLIEDNQGQSYLGGMEIKLDPIYADCEDAILGGRVYAPWTTAWTYGNPVVEAYGKALQEVLAGTKTMRQALEEADSANERVRSSMAQQ